MAASASHSAPSSVPSLSCRLPPSPPLSPSLKALQMSPISDGSPTSALFLPSSFLPCDDPSPTLSDPFELWLKDPDSLPSSPAPVSRPPPVAPADALLSCLAAGAPQPPPPEPDAMLPIYAALGDLIDVDSESMAFHQEEESQPVPIQGVLPGPVSVVAAVEEKPAKSEEMRKKEGKTGGSENGRRKGEKRVPKRADRRKVPKISSPGSSSTSSGSPTSSSSSALRGGKRAASGSGRRVEVEGGTESGREGGRGQRKRKRSSGVGSPGSPGSGSEVASARSSVGGKTGAGRRRTEGGKRIPRATSPDGDERNMPVREKCIRCDTTARNTPMMRKGPDGCRSLCNACGLKWSRHGIY